MTEKSLGTSDPITSLVLTRMLLGERCGLIPIAKAQQGAASRFYIRARDTADMIFTETEDALSHYKNRLTIVKSKFEWENSLSSMLYIDAQAMAQAWREGHE